MPPDPRLELAILIVQQILALILDQQGEESQQAVESNPYRIQTATELAYGYLKDPVVGLPNLFAAIQSVRLDTASPHIGTITDVLDVLANMPPITLPEIPPPGYGAGDLSEVWLSNLETYDWCPID